MKQNKNFFSLTLIADQASSNAFVSHVIFLQYNVFLKQNFFFHSFLGMDTQTKLMFLFHSVVIYLTEKQKQNVVSICLCFTALSMTLHWNKNKMFLFHSVSGYLAVKQKQNVFVSLNFQWFGGETKQNVFVLLNFQWFGGETKAKCFCLVAVVFWPCWHSIVSKISKA